jgi:hypothetical protein
VSQRLAPKGLAAAGVPPLRLRGGDPGVELAAWGPLAHFRSDSRYGQIVSARGLTAA